MGGVLVKWVWDFFQEDTNVLKLDYGDAYITVNILKTAELCTLNG